MVPKYRDILRFLLVQSGATLFERYDGSIAPVSLDVPESVTRNITDAEILCDGNGIAQWDYDTIPTSVLITDLHLYYKPITPQDGGWSGYRYCQSLSTGSGSIANWTTKDVGPYIGYLENSYSIINEARPLTVYCPGIRDDATAEELSSIIIYYRTALWYLLDLTCTFSVLDIEMFDNIGVTASAVTGTHTFLGSSKWKVIGQRVTPNILTQNGNVKLKLLQIAGTGSPPAEEQWTDVLTGGTAHTDVLTGGTPYQEVL